MSYKKKLEECKQAECNPIDSYYRIFTKDDYIRYVLSRRKASGITKGVITQFKESWEGISKGYNFIIGIGQYNNLMFYSVGYFNEHILGNKEESKRVTVKIEIDTTEFEKSLNRIKNLL